MHGDSEDIRVFVKDLLHSVSVVAVDVDVRILSNRSFRTLMASAGSSKTQKPDAMIGMA